MESADTRLFTEQGVNVTKLGFSSHDGVTQIKGLLWSPYGTTTSPKGIIQIAHGMQEHIGRYAEFANFLALRGYVVCAADAIGHGFSVTDADRLSCMPVDGGKDILLDDINELRKMVASRYSRQTPYIVLGHSLGSYLMRAYLTRHGEGLTAAILSGTGQMSRVLSKAGNILARTLARSRGEDHRSVFLESMGVGAYAKKIPDMRTTSDWLCTDEAVVDAYIADPLSGIPFSVGAYAAVTDVTGEVATMASASQVPPDLPILLVAGKNDPVGDNGKAVVQVAEMLERAGVKLVDVILYDNMRHEILNEPNKQDVYTDISQWLDTVID